METDKEKFDRMRIKISGSARNSMRVRGVSEAIDRIDAGFELDSLSLDKRNSPHAIFLRLYINSHPYNSALRICYNS